MMGILTQSVRIITTKPYTPEYFFELVEKYKVTYYITTGFQVNNQLKSPMLSKANLSSVKSVHTCGTKLPYKLYVRYQNFIPNAKILQIYGMTEVGGMATVSIHPIQTGTVGFIAPGITAKIIDFDGYRRGPQERGEICLKMDCKMSGYFNSPEANQKAFDEEGFYHSGDYGWLDIDGRLYAEERIGDLIRTKHGLICPSEIEESLVLQPAIKAACVVAVPGPDSFDLPAAAVVKNTDANINEQDIVEFMEKTFPESKQLTGGIYFMDSLKSSTSGKIFRNQMKDVIKDLYKNRN